MKHEQWQSPLLCAVLSFGISFGALSCLVTGFSLTDVNLGALALCCAMAALIFAVCLALQLGIVPVCAGVVLITILWFWGGLQGSFQTFFFRISDLLDRGYHWGVLAFDNEELTGCSMAVSILGCILAACIASLLTLRKYGWLALILGCIPLAICLLLTDTVPAVWCLILLLSCLLILLLTQKVRQRNAAQGNLLTMILCVPVVLALLILFVTSPQDQYHGQELAQKLEDWVVSLFEEPQEEETPVVLPDPLSYPTAGGEANGMQYINLEAVGPKQEDWSIVMKVTQDDYGYLYLRGATYNHYTGMTWINTSAGAPWPTEKFDRSGAVKELEIITQKTHGILYNTYTPTRDPEPVNGMHKNTERLNSYTVRYLAPVGYDESWAQIFDYSAAAYDHDSLIHLSLPVEASAWASNELHDFEGYVGNSVYSATEAWKLATSIANYVRNSASYDLNTRSIPFGHTDFAKWFMENSESGYCVHFATATAVLLRQAGIPARYVTGYFVQVAPGQTAVRAKDSHAWVEFYVPGIGWMPLESTPGYYEVVQEQDIYENENSDATTPSQHEDTEPTQPSETTPTEPQTEPTTAPTQQTTVPPVSDPQNSSTAPSTPHQTDQPLEEEDKTVLLVALTVLVFLIAVILQWRLRVWLRARRHTLGNTNRQALSRWKEVKLLQRLLRQDAPEELLDLAQKARFSGHEISKEELHRLSHWCSQARRVLRKRSLLHQLYYTIILAIY